MIWTSPEEAFLFFASWSISAVTKSDMLLGIVETAKTIDHDILLNILGAGITGDHQMLLTNRENDKYSN